MCPVRTVTYVSGRSRATRRMVSITVHELVGTISQSGLQLAGTSPVSFVGVPSMFDSLRVKVLFTTAQNTLWNLGRGVGSLGPLAVGALAAKYSFHAAIGLLASIYFLDIVATLFLIPELKGKALK